MAAYMFHRRIVGTATLAGLLLVYLNMGRDKELVGQPQSTSGGVHTDPTSDTTRVLEGAPSMSAREAAAAAADFLTAIGPPSWRCECRAEQRRADKDFVHRLYKTTLCREADGVGHTDKMKQLAKGSLRFGMVKEVRLSDEHQDLHSNEIANECGMCSARCKHMWTARSELCCSMDTDPDQLDYKEDLYCSEWVTTPCPRNIYDIPPSPQIAPNKTQRCERSSKRPAILPRATAPKPTSLSIQGNNVSTAWPSRPTMYVLSGSQERWDGFEKPRWAHVIRHVAPARPNDEWFCLPRMFDGKTRRCWPEGTMNVASGHVQIWLRVIAECKGWCLVSEDDIKWPKEWNVSAAPPPGRWASISMDTRGMLDACLGELSPSDPSYQRMAQFECQIGRSKYNRKFDVNGEVIDRTDTGLLYGTGAYAMTADAAMAWIDALPFQVPVDHHMWRIAAESGTGLVPRFLETQHVGHSSVKSTRDIEDDECTRS